VVPGLAITIQFKDVELAEIMIRISLLLKKQLRKTDGESAADIVNPPRYALAPNRAMAIDHGNTAFARAYETQADAPTQVDVSALEGGGSAAVEEEVVDGGRDGYLPAEEEEEEEKEEEEEEEMERGGRDEIDASLGHEGSLVADLGVGAEAGVVREPEVAEVALTFEDLKPEVEFFAEGLGPNSTHLLLQPGETQPIVQDRALMQKLFLQGKDKFEVKTVANMSHIPRGGSSKNRKRINMTSVKPLLKTFAEAYPRLAVFDGATLQLRQFPEDARGQDLMHTDCMKAVRLTLSSVSAARVSWMSLSTPARGTLEAAAPVVGEGPAQRRRVG
jgi:hypothetical protein